VAAPSTLATKSARPGSIPVAGYQPAAVAEAVGLAERFARFAMSGCGSAMLPVLESMMTPALYEASVKSSKPPVYLTFEPPTIMSRDCVTSQDLSEGSVGRGPEVKGVPSIRVAVTVTEALKVSTTTDPTTLKPVTVSRRYTIDVLPFGKDWQASDVKTSDSKVIAGK